MNSLNAELPIAICMGLMAFAGLDPLHAQDLRGLVDIHAHCGPDVMPRSIDCLELARLAREKGFGGLVLKNHYEATASLAALASKNAPGLNVFGGIALNRAVGGVNPAAVERMTRVEGRLGRVVWMPTFDAANQIRVSGERRAPVAIMDAHGLKPEVIEVLDLAAKHGLVLATGHSSASEVLILVREAKRRGVRNVVVTHAMLSPVSMNANEMREAAELGAFLEFASLPLLRKDFTFAETVEAIRAAGVESCILSSDLGQKEMPLHPDGLLAVFKGLREAGLTVQEIERMAKINPARLLGLP